MSDGMNGIDSNNSFYLSNRDLDIGEFMMQVKNDPKLIDIYKVLDKNGDNKLSQDELAAALGAYNSLKKDNHENLSFTKEHDLKKIFEDRNRNDRNYENNNIKIKSRKLNAFFKAIKTLVAEDSENNDKFFYDNHGTIISKVNPKGEKFFYEFGRIKGGENEKGKFIRSYNYSDVYKDVGNIVSNDGSYADKYDDKTVLYYDKEGSLIAGYDEKGLYDVEKHKNGTVTKKYLKSVSYRPVIKSYDKEYSKLEQLLDANGKLLTEQGIKSARNKKDNEYYLKTFNEDGSYVMKITTQYEFLNDKLVEKDLKNVFQSKDSYYSENYNSKGVWVGGQLYGDDYTIEYDKNKNYTRTLSSGAKDYYDAAGNLYKTEVKTDEGIEVSYIEKENTPEQVQKGNEDSKPSIKTKKSIEFSSSSTKFDEQGNLHTTAIEGETFKATMNRIGITEPDDIELFKKANPQAAKKGWFVVGKINVHIPKALIEKLGDKLNFESLNVDAEEQIRAYNSRFE